jgi:hypothetical protein
MSLVYMVPVKPKQLSCEPAASGSEGAEDRLKRDAE